MKALTPSSELAAVVGAKDLPRTQAIKKIWDYIKKRDLQNPKNRRNILADDTLKKLFGKKEITMFELAKIVNKHLS
ncbi:MAG: DNA topoisomerase III [Bacteriovoracaceae bacterium]|nr:DNA topoisomerase III [Bacteriovoracaceae bacterium]